MGALNSSCEPPGELSGQNAASPAKCGVLDAIQTAHDGELNITGSFNGLLDRLAQIDYFDVWLTLTSSMKAAKKQKREETMRMSEMLTLTGLTKKDVELFISLRLVSIIHEEGNPLLSVRDVFSLVQILKRISAEEVL